MVGRLALLVRFVNGNPPELDVIGYFAKAKNGMPLAASARGIPLDLDYSRTAKLHYCAIHNLSCMMYLVLEYRSYPLHPFSSALQSRGR